MFLLNSRIPPDRASSDRAVPRARAENGESRPYPAPSACPSEGRTFAVRCAQVQINMPPGGLPLYGSLFRG